MNLECQFVREKEKHVLLFPGMLSPVSMLFPLARYLRNSQSDFAVTAIPLGMSLANFELIIDDALENIKSGLLSHSRPKEIILFGHSHGGRVVCALAPKLKKLLPNTDLKIITAAGCPGPRPNYFRWYRQVFYSLSKAFRKWPFVEQPDRSIVSDYIGYCSSADSIVTPEFAQNEFTGTMTELKGFSHKDFINPEKIGPLLLELLAAAFK